MKQPDYIFYDEEMQPDLYVFKEGSPTLEKNSYRKYAYDIKIPTVQTTNIDLFMLQNTH